MTLGMYITLAVQACTFVVLGIAYFATGNWKFGCAQLLLAAVQALVYT